jgi:hypothetical protein
MAGVMSHGDGAIALVRGIRNYCNASSSVLASTRSRVPKPSVKRP